MRRILALILAIGMSTALWAKDATSENQSTHGRIARAMAAGFYEGFARAASPTYSPTFQYRTADDRLLPELDKLASSLDRLALPKEASLLRATAAVQLLTQRYLEVTAPEDRRTVALLLALELIRMERSHPLIVIENYLNISVRNAEYVAGCAVLEMEGIGCTGSGMAQRLSKVCALTLALSFPECALWHSATFRENLLEPKTSAFLKMHYLTFFGDKYSGAYSLLMASLYPSEVLEKEFNDFANRLFFFLIVAMVSLVLISSVFNIFFGTIARIFGLRKHSIESESGSRLPQNTKGLNGQQDSLFTAKR